MDRDEFWDMAVHRKNKKTVDQVNMAWYEEKTTENKISGMLLFDIEMSFRSTDNIEFECLDSLRENLDGN